MKTMTLHSKKPMTASQKKILSATFEAETNFMEELVTWLYNNRDMPKLQPNFDYPKYGGMPPALSRQLSSMEVDQIQEHWHELSRARSPLAILGWFWSIG
jgi:hypothetical protein